MAADKKIMAEIETLRLDRPGRTHQATMALGLTVSPSLLIDALRELAATYREEAELWTKSGARGWKSSETEAYLVAQHIDDVAAQLDNVGGGAALSVSEPSRGGPSLPVEGCGDLEEHGPHDHDTEQGHPRFHCPGLRPPADRSGLDALISAAVAEGRGQLRPPSADWPREEDGSPAPGDASDVAAYLSGAVDTLPGLREALVPGSVVSPPETDNPFAKSDLISPPYCGDCETDTHRCHGCGEPVDHGAGACEACSILHAEPVALEMPSTGPTYAIKLNQQMAAKERTSPIGVPKTWESETMTADGHLLPGVAKTAPPLGQPGDMGAGYSHDFVPPGGRRLTYADLLATVPAASLPPHVSNSQIDTVGDCGAKYRMQRVEQLPQIPQWANIGGTAFHAAVESWERMAAQHPGISLAQEDCEGAWKHHFENTIAVVQMSTTVPISSWRSSRQGAEGRQWWEVNGPLMLRRYLDARPDETTFDVPVVGAGGIESVGGIEAELTVQVPTNYGPVPFVAKLDRVTVGHVPGHPERGALLIRDYKTSYERPTDTTQLGDYARTLRFTLALGGGPLAEVPIYGSYFDARRGEWTEPVDLLAAHPFESFQYRVTAAHAQKRALTTGPTPARPSSYCGGCSVRYACPVKAKASAS